MSPWSAFSRFRRAAVIALLILAAGGCRFFRPPAARTPQRQTALQVYFHREDDPDGPPAPVTRTFTSTAAPSTAEKVRRAVEALLAGPTADERGRGYYSSIPPGVRLLGVEVERPLATLDFSRELEQTGGTAKVSAILSQLAHTAASVTGVKGVELLIEGERVGGNERPFTGEGFLFRRLHPPVDGEWAAKLGPAEAFDLFIAVIPDRDKMWRLSGPRARQAFGSAKGIDASAFAEGLGAWRNYRVERETIENDRATVVIAGRQELEGQVEENARYEARMAKEGGRWRFDLGKRVDRS